MIPNEDATFEMKTNDDKSRTGRTAYPQDYTCSTVVYTVVHLYRVSPTNQPHRQSKRERKLGRNQK